MRSGTHVAQRAAMRSQPSCHATAVVVAITLATLPARADDPPSDDAIVRFRSTGRPHSLEIHRSEDAPAIACETPCVLRLPPRHYELVAKGRRLRTYRGSVDVPVGGADVTIRSSSKGAFVTGIIFTSFGAAGTAVLGLLGGAALVSAPSDDYNQFAAGMSFGAAAVLTIPLLITGLVLLGEPGPSIEIAPPATH
jgi:hypothetical protein